MRQNLGQHFLTNASVSNAMAAALQIAPEETVIEIGPGHGELTQALVAAGAAAKLIAIERDPSLAAGLRERFGGQVHIIEGDVMEELAPLVAQLPAGPYKITGNLPYYLTGHLLRLLSELERKPARTVVMVQKEVAERMVAAPPRMNRLAAAVQFWAAPRLVRTVSRNEFDPAPEVDSAVVELELKKDISVQAASYYAMVRALFAQPRKTVFNNLRSGLSEGKDALAILSAAGVDPKARPQDLGIEDVGNIAQQVEES